MSCKYFVTRDGEFSKKKKYSTGLLGIVGRNRSKVKCDQFDKYCQISNISHTSMSNKIVDHSDVVESSPVGAAPTTSSFST